MRRASLISLLMAAPLAGFAMLPAHADTMALALDEVQTVTFPRPVGTVNVGNPAIADITMIDARRAFIQGKAYGSTNIIALSKDGNPVSNTQVTVFSRQNNATVTLQRGTQRTTYNCTAKRCEATPQPGDGKDAFEAATGQANAHRSAALGAANPGKAAE